jgi:hypothetical protein
MWKNGSWTAALCWPVMPQDVPGQVAVRQDGALGQAGGAAGVENAPGIVHGQVGHIPQIGVHGVALADVAFPRPGIRHGDDVVQRGAAGFELYGLFAPLLAVHQHLRGAAFDDALQFVHRQPPVQVLQHRADLRRRPEQIQVLGPVRRVDRHAVALADAEAAQVVGGAVGPLIPLGESGFRAGGIVDQRDSVRRQLRPLVEPVGDEMRCLVHDCAPGRFTGLLRPAGLGAIVVAAALNGASRQDSVRCHAALARTVPSARKPLSRPPAGARGRRPLGPAAKKEVPWRAIPSL